MTEFLKAVQGSELVYRLGWALLHAVWLGAAVGAVFALSLLVLRRHSAAARYLAGCAAMLLMVAAPVATFFIIRAPAAIGEAPARDIAVQSNVTVPAPRVEVDLAADVPARVSHAPPVAMPPAAAAPVAPPAAIQVAPPVETPWLARAARVVEPALMWVVLAWAAGVLLLSMWQSAGWIAASRLKRLAARPTDPALIEHAGRLARALNISRPVKLLESMLVRVPTVLGWIRPVILLPVGLAAGLTPQQVQAILAHELAHIRRCDYLVNLLQTLAETLLFYHPAMWFISRRIRVERENCCDDIALAAGAERFSYAESLLHVVRQSAGRAGGVAALSVTGLRATGRASELRSRIGRLLGSGEEPSRRARSWPIAVIIIAAIAIPTLVINCGLRNPSATATQPAAGQSLPQATQPAADAGVREQAEAPFETFRVGMKSVWAWNRDLTIKSDGTYTFEMQTLEKVPGEKQLRPGKTAYIASYRLSPGNLWELTQLLKATQWLSAQGSPNPVATDATEYSMTLSRDDKLVQRTYHEGDRSQPYVDLVRFLRRISRQEEVLFAVTHRDQPFPGYNNLGDELDGVVGVGSKAKPYAPALDYQRLVPAYAEFLVNPKMSPRLSADAAKLMGYLKLESQRRNLEALALGRVPDDPHYAVPADLRKAAVNAIAVMGAGQSLDALKAVSKADDTRLRDAVAEALLTAPSDKAIPILKELADRSQNAAWALIRADGESQPTIVDLLRQPGDENGGGRAAYFLIRAYHDHWKEAALAPDAKVLSAIHDKVRAVAGFGGSLISEYGTKVLELAGDPFVLLNVWQDLDATLSLMAAKDQQARKDLLLPMHFRNNKPPEAFLKDVQSGALSIRRVMVEGYSAWANIGDPEGQKGYVLYLSQLGGRAWVIEAAQAAPADKAQTELDHFLKAHPQAKEVTQPASRPSAATQAAEH